MVSLDVTTSVSDVDAPCARPARTTRHRTHDTTHDTTTAVQQAELGLAWCFLAAPVAIGLAVAGLWVAAHR